MTIPRQLTPAQEKRLRRKIDKIRKEISYERQKWGGHHDGRGLRYLPPDLFIQLCDYKGGLRYLRWFDRTFPDDATYPMFLFDWALILYKTGKTKEAELKAYGCLIEGDHIMETFIGSELLPADRKDITAWKCESVEEYCTYSASDPEYSDYAVWLKQLFEPESMAKLADRYRTYDAERREKIMSHYQDVLDENERLFAPAKCTGTWNEGEESPSLESPD